MKYYYMERTKGLLENREMLDSVSKGMSLSGIEELLKAAEEKERLLVSKKRSAFQQRVSTVLIGEREIGVVEKLLVRLNSRIKFYDNVIFREIDNDKNEQEFEKRLVKRKNITMINSAFMKQSSNFSNDLWRDRKESSENTIRTESLRSDCSEEIKMMVNLPVVTSRVVEGTDL